MENFDENKLEDLISALKRLLNCPALNLDNLEPEDYDAISQATKNLKSLNNL